MPHVDPPPILIFLPPLLGFALSFIIHQVTLLLICHSLALHLSHKASWSQCYGHIFKSPLIRNVNIQPMYFKQLSICCAKVIVGSMGQQHFLPLFLYNTKFSHGAQHIIKQLCILKEWENAIIMTIRICSNFSRWTLKHSIPFAN